MVSSLRIRRVYYRSWWRSMICRLTTFLVIRSRIEEALGIQIHLAKIMEPDIAFTPVADPDKSGDLTATFDGVRFYYSAKAGTIASEQVSESIHGRMLGYDLCDGDGRRYRQQADHTQTATAGGGPCRT